MLFFLLQHEDVLKLHIKHVHNKPALTSKPTPHKCELCPEEFATAQHLKTHMEKHFVELPLSCSECAYRYSIELLSQNTVSMDLISILMCVFSDVVSLKIWCDMRLFMIHQS